MPMYLDPADFDIHYQIGHFEMMYPSYICIKSGEHGFSARKNYSWGITDRASRAPGTGQRTEYFDTFFLSD